MVLKIRLLLSFCVISLQACAHQVFSLDVDDQKADVIRTELERGCSSDRCSLGRCWSETEDLIVCAVEMSTFSGSGKQELLERVRTRLSKQQIDVGFCGHDSTGTQVAGGIVCALVAGALSGGRGGATAGCGHDQVEAVGPENEIDLACSTEPDVHGSRGEF
jgi:hypothetical protein